MSEKLGTVKVGDFSVHPHLRIDGPQPDQLAPETAREIDLEVRRLVNTALEAARDCLRTHKDQLDKLAEALLDRETLSIDEINVLLGLTPPPEPPAAETAISDAFPFAVKEYAAKISQKYAMMYCSIITENSSVE